jgi:hypothetical protein
MPISRALVFLLIWWTNPVQIESCTPIDIAFIWVAAEIVAADKKDIELSPISISNRFVLAYCCTLSGVDKTGRRKPIG